ncbi:MAG TPA: recombination-associated protein RdgC [Hydrogenophaga sp.]|uniref:recombination-associated protein RdgC n=1 Tax=Hydrogenophaga sp. TaxID=1904254 RepID=UPI002CBDA40B|nr:recombination-associated protein RdgC [Hydrogenophaga sp.]HSX91309.1 recombination-associated protein RdgC [Hydrogenophaga sp.]
MFKNLTLYRIGPGWAPSLDAMEKALDAARFVPCPATQDKSVGWVEPRGEAHGPLVEAIAGQRILKLQIETKSVPGAVVRRKAQEAADHIEATTGRKPGKKETKTLREDALLSLLPQAFARQQSLWVWIDPERGWLATDASSQGKVDDLITALVRAFDGLVVTLFNTQVTPQTAMTQWLSVTDAEEWPEGLAVERDCELRSSDEEKSVVKFTRHHLFNDEVRRHIAEGKLPVRLALNWEGRVGFTLTESMALKKINFLEGVFEDRPSNDDETFDSNVAIGTGELRGVLDALIAALGGELQPGQVPGHEPAPTGAAPVPDASAANADAGAPF